MEGIHEVGGIGLVGLLDSKIVNHQGEVGIVGVMLPQTGGVGAQVVAVWEQELLKLVIGKFSGLG